MPPQDPVLLTGVPDPSKMAEGRERNHGYEITVLKSQLRKSKLLSASASRKAHASGSAGPTRHGKNGQNAARIEGSFEEDLAKTLDFLDWPVSEDDFQVVGLY